MNIEIIPDGKMINPACIWQGNLHFDWLLLIPSTISSIPVIISDTDKTKFIIIPALSAFLYCLAMRDSSRNIENLKNDSYEFNRHLRWPIAIYPIWYRYVLYRYFEHINWFQFGATFDLQLYVPFMGDTNSFKIDKTANGCNS